MEENSHMNLISPTAPWHRQWRAGGPFLRVRSARVGTTGFYDKRLVSVVMEKGTGIIFESARGMRGHTRSLLLSASKKLW